MLFETYQREYKGHRTRKFSAYDFLNISDWQIANVMRECYNVWGQDFADDNEFISRFKSKLDQQHYSASFELLTYITFKNLGFSLEKHPFTGTSKRLDFGVRAETNFEAFLECTLSSNSFESLKEKNQKEAVIDIIEDINQYPYFINLDFRKTSGDSISKKKLLAFIDKIKEVSADIPNEALMNQKYLFVNNGWEIRVSLIRKTNPKIERSLGAVTQNAKTINTSKPILTALMDKKPSNYKITTQPYVICLNTEDLFVSDECFPEVLFGQYGNDRIDLQYSHKNGFFLTNKKAVNTTVSAVIFFKNFDSFTLNNSSITVWHNPFARNPIPVNILPFDEYTFKDKVNFLEQETIKKDIDLLSILGIDRNMYVK